ncbi:Asp-tRNA(Asn)/Glu-tRNA(Gln) amidotransferase subunit GatB [Candidatus Kaiserbacteria bacterium]|nr:Asp-tRNA(Asn)/Glu-tRNA(Gln) amidotransferase subunit GatB [Candidatus Kaiserbacteria bacterium]
MQYRPTIGLEVHAELSTKTKMFCNSANNPDEVKPNVNVCPVCLAHPGTLPVINHDAVRHMLRIGAAVGGTVADFSEFDRKSYFYPDIPKGYQITQYEYPFISGGVLAGVAITRVHLEEDTARSIHAGGKSLVDFNRAGIPLMELVTEPVMKDAETAGRFARELQLLLRTLCASEANLEKGEMRIEANVSVSNQEGVFGTKVEVKNINSFRSVERAITYEIKRQIALLEKGGKVVQETRGWDETKQETFHQRFKEGSADYRYFPEPDLPKLLLSEVQGFSNEAIRASLPELPWERRGRYTQLGLKEEDIEFIIASIARGLFFDAVVKELEGMRESSVLAANYFISDLAGESGRATPTAFAKLIRMYATQKLSSRGTKDTLLILIEEGGDPETIAQKHNLLQIHDVSALEAVVDTVLAQEEKATQEYKNGKQAALQYLVGKAMKESRGAGNPLELQKLIVEKLT